MRTNRKIALFSLLAISLLGFLCFTVVYQGRIMNTEGKKAWKIGVTYMTMNNPYFQIINKEIKTAVEDKGDILYVRDANMDSDMQLRQIEDMIKNKMDIILVNCVDMNKIIPALKKASEAGIPLLAIDAEVEEDAYVTTTVVSANYSCGILAAQDLMSRRTSARILLLIQSNNQSARDRINGFLDTLNQEEWSYEIVDQLECQGQLEVTEPLVEDFLDQKGKVDVIMALNDPSALGAMAALDSKGLLNNVNVYGVDGAPAAKNMIKEGKMTATVVQSPRTIGQESIDLAYKILSGKKVPKKMLISVSLLNQENIEEHNNYYWE